MSLTGKSIGKAAGAALVASLMAGCSSDTLRFQDGFYTGADSLTTASVPTPQASVGQAGQSGGQQLASVPPAGYPAAGGSDALSQPYPGDVSGSNRYALAPTTPSAVQSSQLPPPSASTQTASLQQPASDPLTTGTTPQQDANRPRGWSTEGAPRVTLEPNETIYSVSRRYGVPAEEIMKANGITDPTRVRSGQQLIIPGYSRGGSAQVAATTQPAAQQPASTQQVASLETDPRYAERSLNEQAAAISSPGAPAGGSYTVQPGDTLSKISRQTGLSVDALRRANGLSGDTIRVGQTLSLGGAAQPAPPPTQVVEAKPAATDPQQTASVQAAPAVQQVASASPADSTKPAGYTPPQTAADDGDVEQNVGNDVAAIAPETTGIGKLRWPAQGQIVTAFGAQDGDVRNDGIDILVPEGSEVKAAENGVVIYAGSGLKEYGNTVLVRHDNGLVTVYGHAEDLTVQRGDKVTRGQVIAHSGMTGSATRPKLHFEVRENATPVNPTKFLE